MKPFFNDACSNQNSPMRVNHVTKQQFKQVVRAHVARELGDEEMSAVADRFGDGDGFVNFVSFSACVDPKESCTTRTDGVSSDVCTLGVCVCVLTGR